MNLIEKEQLVKLKKIDGKGFFKRNPFQLFGSEEHQYQLNYPLSEKEILNFEKTNQIQLPIEYRNFIKDIGNGGAGPVYGIFRLQDWDLELDIENKNFLNEKFPHTEKWNLIFPENQNDEYDSESDAFVAWESECFSERHIYGSIRICHFGCAIYYVLVVSGVEKGNIWVDARATDEGIYPVTSETKSRYNFAEWYNEWIADSLKKLGK
ncbi:SMI1/KNR4 family protein [Flavobacterium sp. DG1-102-2]|uniref:SMI1/KNR4 family protein n=1 Tax=Flavobacterium sp. DG1-102-2 TaxID=3081663 RepID=UPI002949DFA2|nr:SMI1/KNR4 family protein [Flavobacterium sp. DG1-102-2]MDV6168793.1 SMI1/KNR4 family protein [Flavobacterium sp. DG1-102-2]